MIGLATTKRRKGQDDTREKIRELFEARDKARQVRVGANARLEKLIQKRNELAALGPSFEEMPDPGKPAKPIGWRSKYPLLVAEDEAVRNWRLTMGRHEAGEATADALAAAAAAVDAAQTAIDENAAKIDGLNRLIVEADNAIPGLKIAEEIASGRPWRALADCMEAEVQEAARVVARHYVCTLNTGPVGMNADVYLRVHVPLGNVAEIARQLEEEYRG
jgi:hypothetical protein